MEERVEGEEVNWWYPLAGRFWLLVAGEDSSSV